MKAKIRSLVKNPRYRLLHIGDNHYIIDMGNSIWKPIFPFFTWIFPNSIYKVDDKEMVKRLKAPIEEKVEGPGALVYGGLGVLLPNLTGSLVDYFDLSMPFWLSLILLLIALMSVVFLFRVLSQRYKNKLHHIVQLESLQCYKIRLHPKSIGHVFKFFLIYLFFLALSILSYILYVSTQNIFVLFMASILLFFILLSSLFPGEEGSTTVKFLDNPKNVS